MAAHGTSDVPLVKLPQQGESISTNTTPNGRVAPCPTLISTAAIPPAPLGPSLPSHSAQRLPTQITNTQPSQSYWTALKHRLPFSERTHTIIAWVIGLTGVVLSVYYARKTWNLGAWTAKKDFNQWCENDLTSRNTTSDDCKHALQQGLSSPPILMKLVRRGIQQARHFAPPKSSQMMAKNVFRTVIKQTRRLTPLGSLPLMVKAVGHRLHWVVENYFRVLKIEISRTLSTLLALGGRYGFRRSLQWGQFVASLFKLFLEEFSNYFVVEGAPRSITATDSWLTQFWYRIPWHRIWQAVITSYGMLFFGLELYVLYLRQLTHGARIPEQPNETTRWPPYTPVYIQVGVKSGPNLYHFLDTNVTGITDEPKAGKDIVLQKIHGSYQKVKAPTRIGHGVTRFRLVRFRALQLLPLQSKATRCLFVGKVTEVYDNPPAIEAFVNRYQYSYGPADARSSRDPIQMQNPTISSKHVRHQMFHPQRAEGSALLLSVPKRIGSIRASIGCGDDEWGIVIEEGMMRSSMISLLVLGLYIFIAFYEVYGVSYNFFSIVLISSILITSLFFTMSDHLAYEGCITGYGGINMRLSTITSDLEVILTQNFRERG